MGTRIRDVDSKREMERMVDDYLMMGFDVKVNQEILQLLKKRHLVL